MSISDEVKICAYKFVTSAECYVKKFQPWLCDGLQPVNEQGQTEGDMVEQSPS